MIILSILFFITAILYSSVGFGGGSTYLALLLIWGVPYTIFPIIALACNIIVVSGNCFNYIRAGNLNLKLNQKEINQILNKAKEINFNNLKSEYTENISDLPTTYVTINKKTIKNYYGAPKELKDLEKLIESIILEKMNIEFF